MDIHHERLFLAITNIIPIKHIERSLTLIEEFELHYLNTRSTKMPIELYGILYMLYSYKKYSRNLLNNIILEPLQEFLIKEYIKNIIDSGYIISFTLANIIENRVLIVYKSVVFENDNNIYKYDLYFQEFYEIIKIIENIFECKLINNSSTSLLFNKEQYNEDEVSLSSWLFDFKDMYLDDYYYYGDLYDCYNSELFIDQLKDELYEFIDHIKIKYEYWYFKIILKALHNVDNNYFIHCDKYITNINSMNGLFRYYVLCMKKNYDLFDFSQFENIVYLSLLTNNKKYINIYISKYILYCLYPEYQNLFDILEPIVYNNYNKVINMLFYRVIDFL